MYGPGAQSDEVLIFKSDGTGRLDFINFVLCTSYAFMWDIGSTNHLNLVGTKTLQIGDDGETIAESDHKLSLSKAQFRIALEDTPSGTTMRVFRIKLMDGMSDHFGFVRSDISGFEEPCFD